MANVSVSKSMPYEFREFGATSRNQKIATGVEPGCYCQFVSMAENLDFQFVLNSGTTPTAKLFDNNDTDLGSFTVANRLDNYYTASFDLTSITVSEYDKVYILIYVDGTEDLISECIQLVNENGDYSSDYSSDYYINSNNALELLRITYSNNTNFDSIDYEGSPTTEFSILIRAHFWKQDWPKEMESIELSNNSYVTTMSTLSVRTRLETGYLPRYVHNKINRILMHDNISIGGVDYVVRDEYDHSNIERYGLSRGNIWLTEKSTILKNVI